MQGESTPSDKIIQMHEQEFKTELRESTVDFGMPNSLVISTTNYL
jgi:hypothetical protein